MIQMTFVVATFYKFIHLANSADVKDQLKALCHEKSIKGTILLADEGINGTIAGLEIDIEAIFDFLRSIPCLEDLMYQKSQADFLPFRRLRVRQKKEIVTLGMPEIKPDHQSGTHVSAQEWNDLIQDPDVLVLDTRNIYETDIGSFDGSIKPNTDTFRQFPEYVRQNLDPKQHFKIAMFCTGGIRCEKGSSFLLSQGFKEVYQLKGGILNYLAEISPEESSWQGECFVFDQRVALKSQLEPGTYEMCHGCGNPISQEDRLSAQYQPGISCPKCYSNSLE